MKTTALVLLLCLPVQAFAQMAHVPAWTMVGGKACYEFADAKALVQLDDDLSASLSREANYQIANKALHETVMQMTVAAEQQSQVVKTMTDNRDELKESLTKETTRANTAEANKGGIGLPWIIAGGATLLVLGFAGGLYVGLKK